MAGENNPLTPSTEKLNPQNAGDGGLPAKFSRVINLVRSRLRDYAELNRLISGFETSDREIALAIVETIEDFNTTPPLIDSFTLSNFPSMSILVQGAIIRIIESVGLLQTRNQMSFTTSSGHQVGVSDKTPLLLQWWSLFTQSYEKRKVQLKKAINLNGALNGTALASEYAYLDGLWSEL